MTNQDILDKINEIIASVDINNKEKTLLMLKKMKLKLIEDMEYSDAKKDGKTQILKAFKYVLKNVENKSENSKEKRFHKVFKHGNSYVVTDTHIILVYYGKLNFNEAANPEKCPEVLLNVLKTFSDKQHYFDDNGFIKIDIPSKAVVKNVISEQNAYNKLHNLRKKTQQPAPIYQINDDGVEFDINAEYLLNLINIGITELYCKGYMFYGFNADRSIKAIVFGVRRAKEM